MLAEYLCELGKAYSEKTFALIPLNNRNYETYLRRALELYPFFVQCLIIPGTAFERWLMVCRPSQVSEFKRSPLKYFFYFGVSSVALLIPTTFFALQIWYQRNPLQYETIFYPEFEHIYYTDEQGYALIRVIHNKEGPYLVKKYDEVCLDFIISLNSKCSNEGAYIRCAAKSVTSDQLSSVNKKNVPEPVEKILKLLELLIILRKAIETPCTPESLIKFLMFPKNETTQS